MTIFADITFLNICLALLTLGAIERLFAYLPADVVGPNGWLLQTGE